jgi:UDP-glucose 4-epimerase
MNCMNILVTGGAGFIASHIVDALVERGQSVAVLDNLSSGKRAHVPEAAVFYEGDINGNGLHKSFGRFAPDIVIHHAAQIDVQTSLKRPTFDADENILGTIRVLEACRDYGVAKLIYASSAAVYGVPERLPVDEAHRIMPVSFYGISKHTPEHYIQAFSELCGLDYTILRYANVYGERQDPRGEGGVVSIFTERLLRGSTPIIFGDGEQTRDFIYVGDVASANLAAIDRGSKGIYNISCNEQTSVNELLRTMCELVGTPFAPHYHDARPGDIIHSCLDNRRANRDLGWSPRVSLRDGVQATITYYRDRI